MKRKFYFHRQNEPLDSDHVIYVVWIGESVREQKLLTRLMAWSFEHGATLRSWSEEIDFYLDLEAERVFSGRSLLDFGFAQAHINAQDLWFLMQDNSFDAYEAALTVPKNFIHQISTFEPIRVRKAEGRIMSNQVLTSPRKNLSERISTKPTIISFV